MKQICRKVVHINVRLRILQRVSIIRQFFRFIWDRILVCSIGKAPRYRRLSRRGSFLAEEAIEAAGMGLDESSSCGYDSDSDLVTLKISLLGDCQIGKTSFVVSPHSVIFFLNSES